MEDPQRKVVVVAGNKHVEDPQGVEDPQRKVVAGEQTTIEIESSGDDVIKVEDEVKVEDEEIKRPQRKRKRSRRAGQTGWAGKKRITRSSM